MHILDCTSVISLDTLWDVYDTWEPTIIPRNDAVRFFFMFSCEIMPFTRFLPFANIMDNFSMIFAMLSYMQRN